MKPINQTKFGQGGNCVQAVLASLLETELEVVPDFMNIHTDAERAFREMNEWLAKRYELYLFPVDMANNLKSAHKYFHGYWIGDVKLIIEKDIMHIVVMKGNCMVHDPAGHNWTAYELKSAWLFCKVMK